MPRFMLFALLPILVSCTTTPGPQVLDTPWPPTQVGLAGSRPLYHIMQGLEDIGFGDLVWDVEYRRGDIGAWACGEERLWDEFDAQLALHPETQLVWLQIAVRDQIRKKYQLKQYRQVKQTINRIRERTDVPIYVSGLPGRRDGPCVLHGRYGREVTKALTNRIIRKRWKRDNLRLGPGIGPYRSEVPNGCRANAETRKRMAQQAAYTFGWTTNLVLDAEDLYDIDLTPGKGGGLNQ